MKRFMVTSALLLIFSPTLTACGSSPEKKTQQVKEATATAKKQEREQLIGAIPEATRREIFTKTQAYESKAGQQAESKYPIPSDPLAPSYSVEQAQKMSKLQGDYKFELIEKYRNELLAEYNITYEQWAAIGGYAFDQGWMN